MVSKFVFLDYVLMLGFNLGQGDEHGSIILYVMINRWLYNMMYMCCMTVLYYSVTAEKTASRSRSLDSLHTTETATAVWI